MKSSGFSLLIAFCIALLGVEKGYCGPSRSEAQRAMTVFFSNPGSFEARSAGQVILKYAESSKDHEVYIDPEYMPWINDPRLPSGSNVLFIAFIAGNLQEQFRKGSSQPEAYAGVQAVLRVYQRIREKVPAFQISKVDKFLAMERKGTLYAYVSAVKKEG